MVQHLLSKFALALIAIVIAASPTLAQRARLALVIGNSDYRNTPKLENPSHDAADMAAAFRDLGFEVIEARDLDKATMDRTLRDFAEALIGRKAAVFFYAGHGLQVGGQNYLVPVDARLTTAAALDFEMVQLDIVQRTMERETQTNILILDACRDNPLARNLARALGTRSTAIGRGLAAVESGEGTLISYSTQPGNVALDGVGRNSPFATALLKHIRSRGEDLPSILINVRNDVMQATERRQVPWEHSALTAKFYFTPPLPPGPTPEQQMEMTFWTSVKDSTNPAVLQSYLERYPGGTFAPLARALIEQHRQQMEADRAAREEQRRRHEEARKAEEIKRIEEDRKAREKVLLEERRQAQEAKDAAKAKHVEELQTSEARARAEELRKAQEEARAAREAAKLAEDERIIAVRAAEEARASAARLGSVAEKQVLVALPKPDKPLTEGKFDGSWTLTRVGEACAAGRVSSFSVEIVDRKVAGGRGSVSQTGAFKFEGRSKKSGRAMRYTGTLSGNSGEGTFYTEGGSCMGTFSAKRN